MMQKQAPVVCRVKVAASTIIPPRAMMNALTARWKRAA